MTQTAKAKRKEQRAAALMLWIVKRSSRNKSFIDRMCRKLINKARTLGSEDDFMRDPLVDNDPGFDPGELDRYQRGETP